VQLSLRLPKDSSPLLTTAKREITTAKKPDEETLIGAQQSAKEVAASPKKFWRYCAVIDLFCANRIPCYKLHLEAHHGQVIYSGKSRSNQPTLFTVTRNSTPEQQLPNPSSSPPLPSHTKKHEIQQNTTFQFKKKSEAKLVSPNTTGKLSRRLKTSSSCSITKMEVSSPCQ